MLYDMKRWGKETKSKPETKTIQPWQVILLLAANKIEAIGWTQGQFERHYLGKCIGYCALGAIRTVGGASEDRYIAEAELGDTLEYPVSSWNDHPDRTKEEVVAKLREVAAG